MTKKELIHDKGTKKVRIRVRPKITFVEVKRTCQLGRRQNMIFDRTDWRKRKHMANTIDVVCVHHVPQKESLANTIATSL